MIEEYTDPNRLIPSTHLSHVYLGGSSVHMTALQTSPMLPQKTGDRSTSTSRSVSPPFSSCFPHGCPGGDLPSGLRPQHDSIRTVQDTLAYISQPQSGEQTSASGSGNASQQVFIQSLPPVLVLHFNRVRYDAAVGGITKIGKSIQLAPELEIPLGNDFPFSRQPRLRLLREFGDFRHHGTDFSTTLRATSLQALWSPLPSRRICR
jgi:hypothetical protein